MQGYDTYSIFMSDAPGSDSVSKKLPDALRSSMSVARWGHTAHGGGTSTNFASHACNYPIRTGHTHHATDTVRYRRTGSTFVSPSNLTNTGSLMSAVVGWVCLSVCTLQHFSTSARPGPRSKILRFTVNTLQHGIRCKLSASAA